MNKTYPSLLLTAVISIVSGNPLPAATTGTPPFFQESFSFPLGDYWCANHLSVADMDGDGRRDIVLMATALSGTNGPPWSYQSRALLLHGETNGTFTDSVITNFPGEYGYGAVTADLNNDGATDLIMREHSATHVLLNDGRGAFREVWTGRPGYYNLAVSDANHDGFKDIISGTQTGGGGLIELFTNNGAGTGFQKSWQSRLYGSGYDSIETVLSVNLNNDGDPDIAAREIYGGRLVTLFGTDSGDSFVESDVVLLGERTFALAAGRVNGDAVADIAAFVGWGNVQVFVNRGDGSMTNYWESPNLGQAAYNLALADFDRDGFDDLFVGTFGDGALRIYRNNPGVGFDLWWQGSVPAPAYTGVVDDVDGDGYPDLIVGEKNRLRILLNRFNHPRIANLVMTEAGAIITWAALPGNAYRVQFKTRLADSEWTDLNGDVTADTTSASKADDTAGPGSQRFYRVVKLP
jgi:FG-GAP-like repeat